MKRSKLEIYLKVLEAFVTHGPIRITKVTYEANINNSLSKQIISEFLKNGLLEERKLKKTAFYAPTAKAKKTLEQFKEISQLFPYLKECLAE
jgi:predicted transcriptional regulator